MPVYNCERYVGEAIESVLSQTFRDFELIIVDDGSSDGTGALVDKYRELDPRVVVLHKPNGGIVSALNLGLEHCKGDYIARMDGDDICAPNRFAVQLNYLDEHQNCVCVGGNFRSIDEAGTLHEVFRYSRNKLTSFEIFPVRVALTCHPLATFRRTALLAAKGYRNTFPHAEDYDLFLRIADFGQVDNPDELLFYYRGHPGSVSRRNLELQETEATYAELAALLAHRGHPDLVDATMDFDAARRRIDQVFPPGTTAAYLRFRVWRRLVGIDPVPAARLKWRVLLSAFSLSPANLFSGDYWNLRIRILGRFVLNEIEARRKAPSRETEAPA
jgi:glycosyltransferase involved in cell wall biosynthesis